MKITLWFLHSFLLCAHGHTSRGFFVKQKVKKICNCETNLYNVNTFISDKQEDEQKREGQRSFPQRSLHCKPLTD